MVVFQEVNCSLRPSSQPTAGCDGHDGQQGRARWAGQARGLQWRLRTLGKAAPDGEVG